MKMLSAAAAITTLAAAFHAQPLDENASGTREVKIRVMPVVSMKATTIQQPCKPVGEPRLIPLGPMSQGFIIYRACAETEKMWAAGESRH